MHCLLQMKIRPGEIGVKLSVHGNTAIKVDFTGQEPMHLAVVLYLVRMTDQIWEIIQTHQFFTLFLQKQDSYWIN